MNIYFDMDGVIADLYSVENWLPMLRASDPTPYATARPLINLSLLARYIHKLQAVGIKVGIISWGSKNSTDSYLQAVADAKFSWLAHHLPSVCWDVINIIPYGTPKSSCGSGILFDDEEPNRLEWGEGAYSETEIFSVIKGLI